VFALRLSFSFCRQINGAGRFHQVRQFILQAFKEPLFGADPPSRFVCGMGVSISQKRDFSQIRDSRDKKSD
jgi:hypothetical protein